MEQKKVPLQFLKSTLLGGALFLVPLVALGYVVFTALGFMRKIADPIVAFLPWSGFGAVIVADILALLGLVLVCFISGYLARVGMAGWAVNHLEQNFLMKLPGYAMFRGFADSFEGKRDSQRVVLIQFDDQAQLGIEVNRLEASKSCVVYIPGTPEFNAGSLSVVDQSRIEPTNMTLLELRQIMRSYGQKSHENLGKGE